MNKTFLKNAKILPGNSSAPIKNILIENEYITDITDQTLDAPNTLDLKGKDVLAGFIDIHNHGAMGFDVNKAGKADLIEIGKFLAGEGVTGWLPTFVPDSVENYQKVIESIDELMLTQKNLPIARILGIHYEGVFANENMCGALHPGFFKTFKSGNEIEELPKLKKGIHLTTLAPEIENGIKLIRELKKQNWIISIGHTKADLQILEEAFANGAKHLTHFFNAMTGLHHRNLGVVGWALTNKDVTFDIIADGIHVHPKMLELAIRAKTPDAVSLISDSIKPTGLGDGRFEVWGELITVKNGRTKNKSGNIAGSVISISNAFRNLQKIGFTLPELSKMASYNPAKLLGIEKKYGTIKKGLRADLVVLDEKQSVEMTFIGGKLVK